MRDVKLGLIFVFVHIANELDVVKVERDFLGKLPASGYRHRTASGCHVNLILTDLLHAGSVATEVSNSNRMVVAPNTTLEHIFANVQESCNLRGRREQRGKSRDFVKLTFV